MDRFAYFFATFAQMESDRSNSQNRVSHAADLSTVLVSSAGAGSSARLFLRRLGGVPLRQLNDPVAQKRDYIIIRESYASLFHRRLLRTHRERPGGCRAAEKDDERPPPCMSGKEHCEG